MRIDLSAACKWGYKLLGFRGYVRHHTRWVGGSGRKYSMGALKDQLLVVVLLADIVVCKQPVGAEYERTPCSMRWGGRNQADTREEKPGTTGLTVGCCWYPPVPLLLAALVCCELQTATAAHTPAKEHSRAQLVTDTPHNLVHAAVTEESVCESRQCVGIDCMRCYSLA
jgi:hypothetical protein